MAKHNNNLPSLADLHQSPAEAFKQDQLLLLLNQPPNAKWIKNHPLAKVKNDQGKEVPSRYMPIDKVEYLLNRIFQKWRVEVLREGVMFNSVYCTVRLHYMNPVSGEWSYHDGVGAKSIQKDKDASFNVDSIKDAAVMMALPSAKSFALKDAAEHLGSLFGRDLNRRDVKMFSGSYDIPEENESPTTATTETKTETTSTSGDEPEFEY